jgi:ferric-dicitrate binding protein FerR (iron transport regulator)
MSQQQLLQKFAAGTTTPEEHTRFNEWFEALSEVEQQEVLTSYEQLINNQPDHGTIPPALTERLATRIRAHEQQQQKGKLISILRIAAAAILLLLAGIAAWFTFHQNKTEKPTIVSAPSVQDKAPGSQGAILTLADGKQIVLDSAANGQLVRQGNILVTKQDGKIVYAAAPLTTPNSPLTFNTMVTPRGRQFQLVLPDGSKVWLNAASSVRYPTAFTGKERTVEITGEAYFEIVKNEQLPFKVKFNTPAGNGGEVEVLGTHFNINAYADEPNAKTTLLEGRIKIAAAQSGILNPAFKILQPGEQATLSFSPDKSSQISIRRPVDTDEVMAWKNGLFQFNETPFSSIMRQVARWYDVDVIYDGTIPEKKFTADLSRQTQLSEFLKVLELSGIRFSIDANTLHVKM